MDRIGFIREKRDIKILALYALSLLPFAAAEDTVLSVCLVDGGFGYFEFAEAFSELQASGHVDVSSAADETKLFSISGLGREALDAFVGRLPSSVRESVQRAAMDAVFRARRDAAVGASSVETADGRFIVSLSLGEENDRLMELSVSAVSDAQCASIERNFKKNAEKIYSAILTALFDEGGSRF